MSDNLEAAGPADSGQYRIYDLTTVEGLSAVVHEGGMDPLSVIQDLVAGVTSVEIIKTSDPSLEPHADLLPRVIEAVRAARNKTTIPTEES